MKGMKESTGIDLAPVINSFIGAKAANTTETK